jgi:hypothetical protein
MANPIIAKTGISAATPASNAAPAVGKTGPSKFDEMRAQLAKKITADLNPAPPQQISEQQKTQLESALRKRLSVTKAANAGDFFAVEQKQTRLQIQNLSARVAKLPGDTAFSPIRDRLSAIEAQFQKSGKLIESMPDLNPQSLIKIQMQMYQLSENVQILSKVVDSVDSGVKTMLQIQV